MLRYRLTSSWRVAVTALALAAVSGTPAMAQAVADPAKVTPTSVTPGRPLPMTVVLPGTVRLPDLKLITLTVGTQKAEVQRVTERSIVFLPPAFSYGLGERDVAVFDDKGTELARGRIEYRIDEHGWPASTWLLFILATLPLALLLYDLIQAYTHAEAKRKTIAQLSTAGLPLDVLRLLMVELGQAPPGVPGLARTMMAFMLMLIVASTIFYVLSSGMGEVPAVVDKTLTVVTTALTTVVAFYFGARTANTAASAASSQAITQASPGQMPAPTAAITTFVPATGGAGTAVTIAGRGFGTAPGRLSFGTVQATPTGWTDGLITCQVPAGLVPGQGVAIEILPQGAATPAVSATFFTP